MDGARALPVNLRDIVSEVCSCHAKAVASFSEAISFQENGDLSNALSHYLDALKYSEEGLCHNVFDHEQTEETWNDIREMQERMIITQGNAKERIYELQSNSLIDGRSVTNSSLPPPYSQHDCMNKSPSAPAVFECEANVILFIENGVQLYFVSSDDQVGSPPPCYPTSLSVLHLNGEPSAGPQVFVKVGEKIYPLVKDQMPVYKSSNGVYMFPNCNEAGIIDGSFGIVIPRSVPAEIRQEFEGILKENGAYCSEDPDEGFVDLSEFVGVCTHEDDYVPPAVGERIAFSLTNGASILSEKLQQGTRYTTDAVEAQSEKMLSNGIPSKTGWSINPSLKKGLEYTNTMAKNTVMIKNWLVEWLQQVTIAVSQQLAPYIYTAPDSAQKTAEKEVSGVFTAGLNGFAKIWNELESSASKITKAVTTAMVKNVEYKYGQDAGEAAGLALGAVASIGETAFTLDNIGVKVIADAVNNYPVDGGANQTQEIDDNTQCEEEMQR